MEPKDLLLHLQESPICPCPQPDQSSLCPANSCNLLIPKVQKTKLEILSEKRSKTQKFYWIFVTWEGLK